MIVAKSAYSLHWNALAFLPRSHARCAAVRDHSCEALLLRVTVEKRELKAKNGFVQ